MWIGASQAYKYFCITFWRQKENRYFNSNDSKAKASWTKCEKALCMKLSVATYIAHLKSWKRKSVLTKNIIIHARSNCVTLSYTMLYGLDLLKIVMFQVPCTFSCTQICKPLSLPSLSYLYSLIIEGVFILGASHWRVHSNEDGIILWAKV